MLIASNVIFAGAYVSGKFGLTTLSPVTLNALRFVLASALLAPIVWRERRQLRRMSRADAVTLAGISILGFVFNKLLEYEGVNLSTASDSALLISGETIFTAGLAWIVLRERASWLRGALLALGLGGTYLIVERGIMPHIVTGNGMLDLRIIGDALFVLSLAFEAVASITSKRLTGRFSPLFVTAVTVVGSLTLWLPAGAWDIGAHGLRLTWLSFGGVVYLAVMTAVGYFLWFAGLQLIEGSAAAATLFVQPLVGTLLAVVVLHDRLSIFMFLGGLCILISVWGISRQRAPAVSASAAPDNVAEAVPLETP
jgi:drug/metabolite transporter (DMT)-like permease